MGTQEQKYCLKTNIHKVIETTGNVIFLACSVSMNNSGNMEKFVFYFEINFICTTFNWLKKRLLFWKNRNSYQIWGFIHAKNERVIGKTDFFPL